MRAVVLAELAWEEVYPGVRRRMVSGERMTVTTYRFAAGARFPLHSHAQEQIVLVRRGSIAFTAPGQSITLLPDHALIIPPDLPHDATAGSEGALVVSIVSPARQSASDYTLEDQA
jgi:quercetin dioxygenase-like cupin family protein